MKHRRWKGEGHRLSLDPEAESTSEELPAFLAPPGGAPSYHGFLVLDGTEVDGFRLGVISGFGEGDCDDSSAAGEVGGVEAVTLNGTWHP